jgi:hypothetical protein
VNVFGRNWQSGYGPQGQSKARASTSGTGNGVLIQFLCSVLFAAGN